MPVSYTHLDVYKRQEQDSSAIKTLLQNNAYQVTDVSLATGDLDEDAKFAILYAP